MTNHVSLQNRLFALLLLRLDDEHAAKVPFDVDRLELHELQQRKLRIENVVCDSECEQQRESVEFGIGLEVKQLGFATARHTGQFVASDGSRERYGTHKVDLSFLWRFILVIVTFAPTSHSFPSPEVMTSSTSCKSEVRFGTSLEQETESAHVPHHSKLVLSVMRCSENLARPRDLNERDQDQEVELQDLRGEAASEPVHSSDEQGQPRRVTHLASAMVGHPWRVNGLEERFEVRPVAGEFGAHLGRQLELILELCLDVL